MEQKYDFDFFVIGGGSGGITAANRAAKLGKRVGLADLVIPTPQGISWGVGGTCVNVGCIPKKLMHYAGLLGETQKDQVACGWNVPEQAQFSWERLVEKVNGHIKSLNWKYKSGFGDSNVEFFQSYASFKDEHTLLLKDKKGNEKTVTAETIVVAVGGRPNYLDIPNCKELCITSDDLFWKQTPPGKTLIVGAGYIALECAGFLQSLKFQTDILVRGEILRSFDKDMVERVVENLREIGVKFIKGKPLSFEKAGDKIKVEMDTQMGDIKQIKYEEYDTVLLAVSRHPDVAGLHLENAKVQLDKIGKIQVNNHWQSSTPNIFALGDVASIGKELTPVAIKEAIYLVKGLYENKWQSIDYDVAPTTVFTPLEYSCAGLTEDQAIAKHGEDNIEVYHSSFQPLEWSYVDTRPSNLCYTKVIVKMPENIVLGVHYVGPNAGEVMAGYAVVVRKKMTMEDIQETIGIHPTTGEEIALLELTKRENPNPDKKGC